jgi:predicted metal-dependent hydrolase
MSQPEWPAGFADGVRLFNGGQFFEAHEAFEDLLDAVEEDGRWDLLVALIQVAVGYHKWTSGNLGAARMLGLGLEKLAAFPDTAWGVDLAALRARVRTDHASAEADAAPGTAPAPRIVVAGSETSGP